MRYLIALIILVGCTHTQPIRQKPKRHIGICQANIPGWNGTKRIEGGQFVTVDSIDQPEFKEFVRAGLTYWNLHAKRNLLIYEPLLPSDLDRPAWIVVRIVDTHTTSTEWGPTTSGRASMFTSTTGESCITGAVLNIDPNVYYSLYMRREADNRLLRRIIHEIGHAIGIPHSWQEGTVMFRESGTELKLGDDSKDILEILYGKR